MNVSKLSLHFSYMGRGHANSLPLFPPSVDHFLQKNPAAICSFFFVAKQRQVAANFELGGNNAQSAQH